MSDTGDAADPGPPGGGRRYNPRNPNKFQGILQKALDSANDLADRASEPRTDVRDAQGNYVVDRYTDNKGYGGLFRETPQETDIITYPQSSRCSASRFVPDDTNPGYGVILMTWRNQKTPWIYFEVPVSVYGAFVSAPSQGKFINSTLNAYQHTKLFVGDNYSDLVYGAMPNA